MARWDGRQRARDQARPSEGHSSGHWGRLPSGDRTGPSRWRRCMNAAAHGAPTPHANHRHRRALPRGRDARRVRGHARGRLPPRSYAQARADRRARQSQAVAPGQRPPMPRAGRGEAGNGGERGACGRKRSDPSRGLPLSMRMPSTEAPFDASSAGRMTASGRTQACNFLMLHGFLDLGAS